MLNKFAFLKRWVYDRSGFVCTQENHGGLDGRSSRFPLLPGAARVAEVYSRSFYLSNGEAREGEHVMEPVELKDDPLI